mgnify:CR=1 FL=1
MDLKEKDLKLIIDYLYAMAFISAWFHVNGDIGRRNTTAQSASFLVSGLGFKPEDVMERFMTYESNWRRGLRIAGIGNKPPKGCWLLFIVILAVAGYFIYSLMLK